MLSFNFHPFTDEENGQTPLSTYVENGACAIAVTRTNISIYTHVIMIKGHDENNWICSDSGAGMEVKIPKNRNSNNSGLVPLEIISDLGIKF